MPFYYYECKTCFSKGERLVVSDRDKTCPICDGNIELGGVLVNPYDNISIRVTPSYYDQNLGEFVTGPGQKKRILKEKDLVEVGDFKHLDDIPLGKPKCEVGTMEDFAEVWRSEVVEKRNSGAEDAGESF